MAIPWVWTWSSYQLVDRYDLPGKAVGQLFMVTLLLYESVFSILLKSLPARDTNGETLAMSFLWVPCVFHSFYVLLQMGPNFPNDNFSFPLTATGLHRLASKLFVTASSPLSFSSNRTLCCWVEENDSFLLWQHLAFIDKCHHKFGKHLSKSGRPRFSIPHKIID